MIWLIALLMAITFLASIFRHWRPWLQDHGWVFPKGESGSAGAALLHIQTLVNPSVQHVIEWQETEDARRLEAESGAPGVPDDDEELDDDA